MHLLWSLIVGLIVGALAKLLMPGRDPGGIIVTMLLGIAGSVLHNVQIVARAAVAAAAPLPVKLSSARVVLAKSTLSFVVADAEVIAHGSFAAATGSFVQRNGELVVLSQTASAEFVTNPQLAASGRVAALARLLL